MESEERRSGREREREGEGERGRERGRERERERERERVREGARKVGSVTPKPTPFTCDGVNGVSPEQILRANV